MDFCHLLKINFFKKSENFYVNISKNLLIVLNNLQQMHLKLFQKEILKKKTEETMGYLIGSKIADKITSTLLPQWSD